MKLRILAYALFDIVCIAGLIATYIYDYSNYPATVRVQACCVIALVVMLALVWGPDLYDRYCKWCESHDGEENLYD